MFFLNNIILYDSYQMHEQSSFGTYVCFFALTRSMFNVERSMFDLPAMP